MTFSKNYLDFLQNSLDKFFEIQKDYIFCKKGCGKCCKNAIFPYTELEFTYLLSKTLELDNDIKKIIDENIEKILKEKRKNKGDIHYHYDCPFLINNICSVYNYRGIVCRTFGLLEERKEDGGYTNIPFCVHENLNYSNIFDESTGKFSKDKIKNVNSKYLPTPFNINQTFLTSEQFEQKFNIKFGKRKPLIDWFSD